MNTNNNDKFARLKAIASGQLSAPTAVEVRFWNFERDGNILGTIIGFNTFQHPKYGEQHTVTVIMAESGELVSAFLNGFLQEGVSRQRAEVGDLILIQFFGKQAGESFNRYRLEIEKAAPDIF